MTILVTGCTGFLGSYLIKSFVELDYNVIGLKRSTSDTYRISEYLDRCTFYDTDNVEIKTIFENHKIDIVINTVTNYGRSDSKISTIVDTNLMFGLRLLEESVNANIKAFINTDTLLDRDINAYALSKAQLVDWMQFLSNQTTKIINIKIEHMYGPLDDANKFIYWLIKQLKENINKIDLTSGIQKRDFIYIEDIVKAYETIVNHIEELANYEEFELGSGKSIEVKEFIALLYTQMQKRTKIDTKLNFGAIAYREYENMNMQADISKLQALGWNPIIKIEDGIDTILEEEN